MKTSYQHRVLVLAGTLLFLLAPLVDAQSRGNSGSAASDGAGAQPAEVVYLEGLPEIYPGGGSPFPADFGDAVETGDSVVTGSSDYVELERGPSELIRVSPDTVFTIREEDRGGKRQSVLSAAAGEIAFRFDRITGESEPRLGSASVSAAVRGTEVTVYVGDEGTTLFLVESGQIAVESAETAQTVDAGQATEVGLVGQAGKPFVWDAERIDYASWNAERVDRFLDEPVTGVRTVREKLRAFAERVELLRPRYEAAYQSLEEARDRYEQIEEEDGEEALRRYQRETVRPLIEQAQAVILNLRYNALSALSLRRFVLGKMYMNMKSRYIFDQDAAEYREFIGIYNDTLEEFEERIVPELVPADI